jgi:aspartate/methionine/tyrosine aminotransferase
MFHRWPSSESSSFKHTGTIADWRLMTSYNSGGTPVYVPLRAPAAAANEVVSSSEWKIDMAELRAAITPRTKMIWVK